jgi:hypothetical protein
MPFEPITITISVPAIILFAIVAMALAKRRP